MARPRKDIDLDELRKLARIHATDEEIAAWFDITVETLRTRKRDEPGFLEVIEKGRAEGKMSLRRHQFNVAEKGNVAMLIWLGKQHLGRTDKYDASRLSDEELIERAKSILGGAGQAPPDTG